MGQSPPVEPCPLPSPCREERTPYAVAGCAAPELAAPAGSAAIVVPAGTAEGGPCLLVLEERILPRNQPLVPRAGACSAAVATA